MRVNLVENMESIKLYQYQLDAVDKLRSGSVLKGGVGSGKTLTSLFFYKKNYSNIPLYIITTAKKRNDRDWEREAGWLELENLIVDSWNNIKRYKDIKNAFFIFDEQKSTGYNTWGKTMVYIARKNKWIMCTATPGDRWLDYMPLFLANNFYKNKTEFVRKHIEYNPYVSFPQIKKIHHEDLLMMWRNKIVVKMPDMRETQRHRKYELCQFPRRVVKTIEGTRWNHIKEAPIENVSEYCALIRRVINTDKSRINRMLDIIDQNPRVIVFYNFEYEAELIREALINNDIYFTEYSGRKHEALPDGDRWVYIVNFNAGAEAWNCITTNVMIMYSLSYSYRTMEQAEGRIDRTNTTFKDLYYYYLVSNSDLDNRIRSAILNKKAFNEKEWRNEIVTRKPFPV